MTIGQCGFGFAPTRPGDRDLNMRMMNRIEAIPLESMRQGMRWDWSLSLSIWIALTAKAWG